MVINKWHTLRSTAWTTAWVLMYPELVSWDKLGDEPGLIAKQMALYLLSSAVLEAIYRWLAWGGRDPHKL